MSASPASTRLAIFGATGAVGSLVCRLLEERNFPFQSIRFFGSPAAHRASRTLTFGGADYPVEPLERERIRDLDLVIASTPDEVAAECAPWVTEQGGIFVDESAAHRMNRQVPLVIPEGNPQDLDRHQGIIASPNCSTIQLVMCLQPIQQ